MFDRVVTQIGVLPLKEILPALLGEVADLLKVERVSYARMEDDGQTIQQNLQFLRSRKNCDGKVVRLRREDYPGYFATLDESSNLVISHDAMADPRLAEFQKHYFKPLGITSMLDVPVRRSGKLFGVISHEHVGPKRRWTHEEVDLARGLGQLVALAVETQERTDAQEELRQALEREKELVALKTNFVSLVSHEFRTPLGIIVSATDILESYFDRLKPEQRAGHLQDIRHSAQQMSNLMEEVLLLGKVESGRMTCRVEPLNLGEVCRSILDEQNSATHRKCPITLKLDGVEGTALGDEGLLHHIFSNLISNAVKYSPAGRRVLFTARREGEFAEFTVEDQGIGIEPADREYLFTAFHRGRNVGATSGTGLGLVIVKRCVDAHGGALTFESQPGKGTRITVRLKLFAANNRREKAQKARAEKPLRRKKS